MNYNSKIGRKSLSDSTKDSIIDIIKNETFDDNKLPPESVLAKRLGVSIAVLREALLLLREDGIITKKHGLGNFFHKSALEHKKRLDRMPGFAALLQANGYEPSATMAKLVRQVPPENVREILSLNPGDEVIFFERTLFADGHHAVYSHNFIPISLFEKLPGDVETSMTLFDIFRFCIGKEVANAKMDFIAQVTNEVEAKQLNLPQNYPFITMEEIYYSLEDTPLGYSVNKFNPMYMKVTMFAH